MIVIEVSIVLCVVILFSILNRLCAICSLLEDLKKLITNPTITLQESMIDHIINKHVKALSKILKRKTTQKGSANDQ